MSVLPFNREFCPRRKQISAGRWKADCVYGIETLQFEAIAVRNDCFTETSHRDFRRGINASAMQQIEDKI